MRRLAGLFIYVAVALYIIYSAHLMLQSSGSKAHDVSNTREQVLSEKIAVSSTPSAKQNSKPTLTPSSTSTPMPTPSPTLSAKQNSTEEKASSSQQNSEETQNVQQAQSNPIANTKEQSHKDYILGKINEYRASQGISAAQPNAETCSFARTRAGEISSNFNHDSFTQKISSNTLPYPSYSLVTENIAMTGNFMDAVNIWLNSGPHAENMRKDTPFICVEQNGNYFAYEGWKP